MTATAAIIQGAACVARAKGNCFFTLSPFVEGYLAPQRNESKRMQFSDYEIARNVELMIETNIAECKREARLAWFKARAEAFQSLERQRWREELSKIGAVNFIVLSIRVGLSSLS